MVDHYSFLREQLLLEHSKAQTLRLAGWVGYDADRVAVLVHIFSRSDELLVQRSAWVLQYVARKAPGLVAPWLPDLVAKMSEPGVHDAVKRNVLRLLEDMPIPEAVEEPLADLCFGFLADPQEAIAVRVFSMTVLEKIVQKFPELKPELRLLIEEHWEHGTAAFRSRGRKVLSRIGKP